MSKQIKRIIDIVKKEYPEIDKNSIKVIDKILNNLLVKKIKKQKNKSLSGKYTSLRNMVEILFAKNKNITYEEMAQLVKEEYPSSSFLNNKGNYTWYKTTILTGEWRTIKPEDYK